MNASKMVGFLAVAILLAAAPAAQADVFNMGPDLTSLETVPVGNPGNVGELSGAGAGGYGLDRICGAVAYEYNIGKYEVTAGQYCEFLNAVGGVDAYGLYNTTMARTDYGSGISRAGGGTPGNPYTYTVNPAFMNRPVNYVSWGDAARFANWLHNGQPSGPQDLSTTEDGAYYLNGATSNSALTAVTREADWKWAITNEDEWYKAAYHNPATGSYYEYPTSSNTAPGRDMADVSGNNANYSTGSGPYPIDSGKYTTVVGEFQNSDSPYGTFDQGGNVWEWNESILYGSYRGLRAGAFVSGDYYLRASYRYDYYDPSLEGPYIGFRVSEVPEPASMALLALGAAGLLRKRRLRRLAAIAPLAAILLAVAILLAAVPAAQADVFSMGPDLTSLETVPVGNPGNVGELSGAGAGGYGPDRICGAVDYEYNIGKYEVTAGQYCEFLNAVAKTDTYGLYNPLMADTAVYLGCNIQRSGAAGSYSYSVAADWANRPVNYVSFWDACRFANWLHNGQLIGDQGPGTTETGAYTLDGYNGTDGRDIHRNANWRWAVTSEDEWYKAAYYDGATGSYFDYPTSSNVMPSNVLGSPTDPGNNATYWSGGFTIGSPYYRTEAGDHENSDSPYGTFDQGGNVLEWNETVVYETSGYWHRGLQGGSFADGNLSAAAHGYGASPTAEGYSAGFRVSEVPEPTSAMLLLIGAIGLARRRLFR